MSTAAGTTFNALAALQVAHKILSSSQWHAHQHLYVWCHLHHSVTEW